MSSSDANTAPTKPPFAVSAAIGSIAGATSKTATAPVERVRLLLQMSSPSTASPPPAGAAVLKQEGATGLWRGNGLAVARAMLQKGLLFATQDQLRVALGSDTAAGAVAGATAAGLTYPLDLLRTRLAGQVGRSSFSAVAQQALAISRQGGGILSLWGGASATLFGGVVSRGRALRRLWLAAAARGGGGPAAAEQRQRRAQRPVDHAARADGARHPGEPHGGQFYLPQRHDTPAAADARRARRDVCGGGGPPAARGRRGAPLPRHRALQLKAAPSAAVQFFTYFELKRAYLHFSGADAKSGS